MLERRPPGDVPDPGFDEWLAQINKDMQQMAGEQADVEARLAQLKRLAEQGELRPRFGVVIRPDGSHTPLVFHPGRRGGFVALHAGDETPARLRPGDQLHADLLSPGQTIRIQVALPAPCGRCWRCRWRRVKLGVVATAAAAVLTVAVYVGLLLVLGAAAQAAGVPPHPTTLMLALAVAATGALYMAIRARVLIHQLAVWLVDSPALSPARLGRRLRRRGGA